MNIKQHAKVVTAGEEEVGHVGRVVIEPRTREVTHIVIHKGGLMGQDKVVAIRYIESANEQKVTLRETVNDPNALPNLEDKTSAPAGDGRTVGGMMPAAGQPLAGPIVTEPTLEGHLNIPDETVVVSGDAKVISSDDKQIGSVDEVVTEPQADRATHFVVKEGRLIKSRKLVPAAWVGNILDDELHLTVSAKTVHELNDYEA